MEVTMENSEAGMDTQRLGRFDSYPRYARSRPVLN